ncbi:MAG: polymorphic toxin type 50 domain-containing protein [Parachlamydiaceae bacterium]|nr:polymorphic toxin type 50 domain-containing protein [Parachlamydiaceae bacterium]
MLISNANKETIVASACKHASEREAFFKNIHYNFNSHNKHVLDHKYYDGKRSIWTHKDPESLLRRYAGKGHPERGSPGSFGYKETVDFKEKIGIWKNVDGTLELPTNRGTIHYGKKGAHIVPVNPDPKIWKNT